MEFQPSAFSRGSYLNVGVQWLWRRSRERAFDVGHRVNEFVPFESEEQFEREAQTLARAAADRVAKLRVQFTTVDDVASYYAREAGSDHPGFALGTQTVSAQLPSSGRYAAAIAFGLIGRQQEARSWFDYWKSGIADSTLNWVREWELEGRELIASLGDESAFRKAVITIISETRAHLNLPPWSPSDWIDPVITAEIIDG